MVKKKRIQDLRAELSKEIETLRRTQVELKMKLKNPTFRLEKKKSLTSRMNQAEDRISGLNDKVEDLDKYTKNMTKLCKAK